MQTLAQIAIFIIQSLGTLYVSLVLLRFLLQLVRADYYNPISKALVKATNPLLVPLRKIIPGFAGMDLAALVLALLLQAVLIQVVVLLAGAGFLLGLTLSVYYYGMFVIIIASWVAPHSHNPALNLLQQLIEPVVAPFRKILPPLGVIDLSPMIFLMVLHIIRAYLLPNLAAGVGLPAGLVMGI
jgi:YggT family protein